MVQQGDSLRLSVNGSLWISSEFGEMAQVKSVRTHNNKVGYTEFCPQAPNPFFFPTAPINLTTTIYTDTRL